MHNQSDLQQPAHLFTATPMEKGEIPPANQGSTTPPPLAPGMTVAPPLEELGQLVTAARLREIVWEEGSRPSLQWIRKETKRRMLPHIRRGRLIFYRPASVLEWYRQREVRPTTMK